MATASIVTIGNELLAGHTTNTNASYLCSRLLSVGIPVVSVYTVGDDVGEIVRALKRAVDDAGIVVTTGGLGPTDDDLTREAFAEFLDGKLQLDSTLLETIQQFFAKRGVQMPEKNTRQAYIPAGAEPIKNPLGTAPGICARMQEKILFALPGVPVEMQRMFEESVLPILERQGPALCSGAKKGGGQFIVVRKVRCFGAGESTIAEKLGNLMERGRNPLINSTVDCGVITLHIVAAAPTRRQAEQMARDDIERLRSLLGDLVFGTDEQTLAEVVGKELAQRHKTIATAESCTGGLLSKLLTDIPGSSAYFIAGWITYSNTAKTDQLGIPAVLIEKYGAVSEQVASAMAIAARQKARSDYALAVTGIAGPGGGSEQKPVGLVYISASDLKNCQTKQFLFSHSRDMIRQRAALTALNMLRLVLRD